MGSDPDKAFDAPSLSVNKLQKSWLRLCAGLGRVSLCLAPSLLVPKKSPAHVKSGFFGTCRSLATGLQGSEKNYLPWDKGFFLPLPRPAVTVNIHERGRWIFLCLALRHSGERGGGGTHDDERSPLTGARKTPTGTKKNSV